MEENKETNLYLIPKNVKAKFQFFTGFGWLEIFIVVTGFLIGVFLFLFLGLFTKSFLRIFVVVLFTTLGFGLVSPDPKTGTCLLKLLKDFKAYKAKPKRYLYIYGRGENKY